MRGTDPASARYSKLVGCEESILPELDKAAKKTRDARNLFKEYKEFLQKFDVQTNGDRVPRLSCLSRETADQDEQQLHEYGGVGGYGAASQAVPPAPTNTASAGNPAGNNAKPDPVQQQAKLDQTQIAKSTNSLKSTLNSQGAAQPLNPVKFQDTMTKLDNTPNTQLSQQEQNSLGPLAVAASKAMQDPSTAGQLKQLINKADTADRAKQAAVKQQQQKLGTNPPMANQQAQPGQPTK
jgi:hypothetical protein